MEQPWILQLDDGRVGHRRQAAALVRYLETPSLRRQVELAGPWRWLAPRRMPGLEPPDLLAIVQGLPDFPPNAIIACGRTTAPIARSLAARTRARTVQVLDCGLPPDVFDHVVVPVHDRLTGANVIETIGSLNPVDDDWLALGALEFPRLGQLPAPRVALLLGGPARGYRFDQEWVRGALDDLFAEVRARAGSLIVATSPRTPGWAAGLATGLPPDLPHEVLEWPTPEGHFAALLAHATHLAATADSVNLVSEACATGKPVRVLGAHYAGGKRSDFFEALRVAGHLAGDDWLDREHQPPLREAAAVAERLRASGLLAEAGAT